MSIASRGHSLLPDGHQILTALQCEHACCARSRRRAHCPVHDADRGGTPDLDVATKDGTVLLICRVGCPQADLIATLQDRGLWPRPEPAPVVRLTTGKPAPKLLTTTPYELGGGRYRHVRRDYDDGSKDFFWEHQVGTAWRNGLGGTSPASLPLYRAEDLPGLPDGELVLVCEGEGATEAARSLGYAASGTVCGAASIPDDDALTPLLRLTAVLWADHDGPGNGHMRGIADRVHALGGTCYRFDPGTEPKDDAVDFVKRGGTREQLGALLAALKPHDPHAERLAGVKLWSGRELYAATFPEPRMIVSTLLPEGAMILAGAPKLGKSRLALNLALAVASGGRALGSIAVEPGDVLYLALEDGARRTRQRAMVLSAQAPERLTAAFEWPRLDAGGLELLDAWCSVHRDARLVVIDTAERIRPASNGRQQLYREDYSFLSPLNDLALKHRVCVVVVHHSNKGEPSDPVALISGSFGLSGAVDGALVLKRERGRSDATLSVHHRDLWDSEYALKVDQDVGSWILLGDADEYRLSSERAEIVNTIRDVGRPVGPKDVADLTGKPYRSVAVLMGKMAKGGLLATATYGKYTLPSTPTYPYAERD